LEPLQSRECTPLCTDSLYTH